MRISDIVIEGEIFFNGMSRLLADKKWIHIYVSTVKTETI